MDGTIVEFTINRKKKLYLLAVRSRTKILSSPVWFRGGKERSGKVDRIG